MRRFSFAWAIATVLLLVATGCGAPGVPSRADDSATANPVWPQAPAQSRIRFVRSISGPGDLGITKSLFRRVVDAIMGRGDEQFVRPTGVAELDGVLYVADPGSPALWILDSMHNRYAKIDEAGGMRLVSPVAVALRPDGAVFVADSALKKVLLLDPDGKLIRVAAEQELERPAALAFDAASERLYIADSARHRIAVYGADGALTGTWGRAGTNEGEFNFPTHLSLDRTGTLLTTDALNFRIQAFDRDGRFLWKFGRHGDGSGDLAAPKGVAADSAGHVYVVDTLFDGVQIFERDGAFLLAFGERGAEAGQFWLPGGLFINAQDRIFVADAYNRRVQLFTVVSGPGTESGK